MCTSRILPSSKTCNGHCRHHPPPPATYRHLPPPTATYRHLPQPITTTSSTSTTTTPKQHQIQQQQKHVRAVQRCCKKGFQCRPLQSSCAASTGSYPLGQAPICRVACHLCITEAERAVRPCHLPGSCVQKAATTTWGLTRSEGRFLKCFGT